MSGFDSGNGNPEQRAHKMEDLAKELGDADGEGNQKQEVPRSGIPTNDNLKRTGASNDIHGVEDNTNPNREVNAHEHAISAAIPAPEKNNHGDRAGEDKPPEWIPSGEEPMADSLIGLSAAGGILSEEGIVKSQEMPDNEEPFSKDETIDDLAHIIEAIIFASDEPLNIGSLKSVLDASHTFGRINPDMIVSRINALNTKYESDGSGFHIIEIAEGYQFATRKELAQWVSYLFKEKAKRKLSNSALETLAIISYKQPITKPEIESIRGVNVDYVLHNLLEKEFVTVVGRAETVGRPLLYGTTQRFLKIFGLRNLEDLPKLREIEEIIKEIRSKGAEESIQLEITALGDQAAIEPIGSGDSGVDTSSKNSSEKQGTEGSKASATDDTSFES
jgi:segregation and condensation protein B